MMNFNPVDFKYFLESARTLNLSRAAERLGIGQPTVSQAIKRLENSFGAKLFDRYKTGVQLTSAGKRLYQNGRIVMEQFDKLKEDVLSSETSIEGTYSIGCHVSVGMYALPPFLRSLMLENAGLTIQLSHGLSREVVEDVISFRTDFGIVVNPTKHPDLIIKELRRDQQGYWAAPNANTEVIIYEPSLSQSHSLLSKISPQLFSFRRRLESSSLELIAELADSGCGVAILPECVAKRYPRLKPFKANLPKHEDRICLIYRADRKTSAAAKLIAQKILHTKI